jgi:hypothetical protein
MVDEIRSRRDLALKAIVGPGTPLRYGDGPDASIDRPAHVRAGSGLARLGGRLAIIQDDTLFVGLLDPQRGDVVAVTLPAGDGGQRQFDDLRGNKADKLDLEACVAVPWNGVQALLAFGSGSTARRESLVVLTDAGKAEVIDISSFYQRLRTETAFSGSELNVEGAVLIGSGLHLFNRGNGAARDALLPVNATCRIDWDVFRQYLSDPAGASPPRLDAIRQYHLGELNNGTLSFTDAAETPLGLLYAASAEDSPDATRDGHVTGSAIGQLSADTGARWIELRWPDGGLFPFKVEGLCAGDDPHRLHVVVDVDDPGRPSELYDVALHGPW